MSFWIFPHRTPSLLGTCRHEFCLADVWSAEDFQGEVRTRRDFEVRKIQSVKSFAKQSLILSFNGESIVPKRAASRAGAWFTLSSDVHCMKIRPSEQCRDDPMSQRVQRG